MIERLEATLEKYNHLQEELTKPEILSDIKKTREYSKEVAALEDVVTCYKKYKKVLEEIESTKEMTKDPELGEMAKEELKELEEEKERLDGELEILLIPIINYVYIKIYVAIVPIVLFLIPFFIEYYKKKEYYSEIKARVNELEEKYLITELLPKGDFLDAKINKDNILEIGKSMLENVNKYKYLQEDYKEYIELWIHEIKIPIATSKMIVENNKSEVTKSIDEELDKIENYIEQALYYARSNTVEKDYIIKKNNLKDIVSSTILKNKTTLIQNNVKIEMENLEEEVYTDSKWCVFILSQIIQNSIKYSKEQNKEIKLYAENKKENVILYIKDNGIGIDKAEIGRVFEKGFTGTNGRQEKKSTGIGLYLCKKLCDKLCIGLEIASEKEIGTEVKLVFPKNSFINM